MTRIAVTAPVALALALASACAEDGDPLEGLEVVGADRGLVVGDEGQRVANDERQGRVVDRLQPEENRVDAGLNQGEAALIRKSEDSVLEIQDSIAVDLDRSEA